MHTHFLIIVFLLLQGLSAFAQNPEIEFDIPVFAYHRFGDDRYASTNISLETFEKQLQFLKDNKYSVFTFGDAIAKWKNGDAFPEKSVIITVDDGYLSFYTGAYPLLMKYGYTATVFVQTGTVGGGDFMSWKQIEEIQDSGIEIGNHSHSHAYFLNFPVEERKREFQADLEKALAVFTKYHGDPPKIYAYPYGEWTQDMEEVLQQKGVIAAAVQKSGVFCGDSHEFAVPRFPMGGPFGTLDGFKNKLRMKALRISKTMPDSPFVNENPPKLTLKISPGKINIDQLQFFVDGEKMEIIKVLIDQETPVIEVISSKKLTGRRTLYTITAPSVDGKSWHWYSKLWVRTEVAEE
jgi:peptidoglycan/xylan/chitin deacetylase (PgdA/CDA1 family)